MSRNGCILAQNASVMAAICNRKPKMILDIYGATYGVKTENKIHAKLL